MCRLAPAHLADADREQVEKRLGTEGSPLPQQEEQGETPAEQGSSDEEGQSRVDPGSAGEEEVAPPLERDGFALERGAVHVDWRSFLPEHAGVDIASRYGLERLLLGEGGDGKVVVATDRELPSRRVAVKKVAKTSAKKTAEFRREIQIMKELDHPNICKLLETFEHGRYLFYVMELCEGGEIFDRIIEQGGLPEALAADVVAQVASALKYAHGRGIAHRDIKPENLCFASTDRGDVHVKVIDWGLGSRFRETAMRSNIGSETYAAPEVMTAKTRGEYTSAVDLWSLGVLAYVMLASSPPFWGSWSDRLASMRAQRYPITGGVWDSVSEEAVAFIRALLRPAPEERLPIMRLLEHPWLRQRARAADPAATSEVLGNLCALSDSSLAGAVCRAAVARQLDHRHVSDIRAVFQGLDEDGDGQLSLAELREGLGRAFGRDSAECARSEELFARCDIDGTGAVSFTEFCAVGLGCRLSAQEGAVWAAFKALDLEDEGRITEASLREVLRGADAQGAWPTELAEELAREMLGRHGSSDGAMGFEAWRELVRCSSEGRKTALEVEGGLGDAVSREGSEELAVNPSLSGEEGRSEAEKAKASPEAELVDQLRFAGA